ncbi:MTH1187 family thiamine-binding protein [Bacteroidota bacterium]
MHSKDKIINLAIQVLPRSESRDAYVIIDHVIDVIKSSGVKHVVCPFETVMEGTYDQLIHVVKKVHDQCFREGAKEVLINIKIQSNRDSNVFIEDKISKYINKNL